jgi:hypothetical protein
LQVLQFKMSVDFRGVEVTMAEELLHVAQTGAAAQ